MGFSGESSNFFDPNNTASVILRNKFATLALDGLFYINASYCVDLIAFLKDGGDVGIFDATNTTRERR